jgi:hypothetical protein
MILRKKTEYEYISIILNGIENPAEVQDFIILDDSVLFDYAWNKREEFTSSLCP